MLFGQIKSNLPSRFIEEINQEDIEKLFEENKSTKEIKINKKDNFNDNAYGNGIVVSLEKSVATIAFKVGIKKILTTYKGLKKI